MNSKTGSLIIFDNHVFDLSGKGSRLALQRWRRNRGPMQKPDSFTAVFSFLFLFTIDFLEGIMCCKQFFHLPAQVFCLAHDIETT